MIKILFVCMGNICRSPAAEGILRDKLKQLGRIEGEDFTVDSAGTGAWVQSAPDKRSQDVCQRHGLNISAQKGRQFDRSDGEKFDLIICMDNANVAGVKETIDSKHHYKVRLFDETEVADPYYRNDGFEQMYQQLENAANRLVSEL